MKEKELIKTFLEWYNKSEWKEDSYRSLWINVSRNKLITTDQLLDLYEQETKQYTVLQIWDEFCDEVSTFSKNLTIFAERYHELKKEGRIKP